jgi:competence protein ComEC
MSACVYQLPSDRTAAVAKDADVRQVNYLVVTHYHLDHVGAIAQLVAKIAVKAFYDYGDEKPDGPVAAPFQA